MKLGNSLNIIVPNIFTDPNENNTTKSYLNFLAETYDEKEQIKYLISTGEFWLKFDNSSSILRFYGTP